MRMEVTERGRQLLEEIIENALADIRVEVRRTRNPEWRAELMKKEHEMDDLLAQVSDHAEVSAH